MIAAVAVLLLVVVAVDLIVSVVDFIDLIDGFPIGAAVALVIIIKLFKCSWR